MKVQKWILILCSNLWLNFSFTQTSADYRYRHYTTEDGLPSSNIYYILQDKKGLMWFSSDAGVCRYDGYTFKTFTKKDGLPDNVVHTLYEDREGRIWFIGMKWQLSYFYQDSIYLFNPENKLNELEANGIFQDKEGALWFFFFNGGLFKYQNGKLENYKDIVKNIPTERTGFAQDSSGRYIVGGPGSYGFIRNNEVAYRMLPERLLKVGGITMLLVTRSGTVIGRTRTHLFEVYEDSISPFFPPAAFPLNTLANMLCETQDGSLLVTTNHGGYRLVKSSTGYKVAGAFLELEYLNMAYEDLEHNLWFSTKSEGIYFLSSTARLVTPLESGNGLSNEIIYSIAKLRNGTICFGSSQGLLQFLKNGTTWQLNLGKDGMINNANELMVDDDNTLWCAMDGGMALIKEKEVFNFKPNEFSSRKKQSFDLLPVKDTINHNINLIRGGSVKSIARGTKNDIWMAVSAGLYRIVKTPEAKVIMRYGKNRTSDVCVGNDGRVWIASPAGLTYLLNDSTIRTANYTITNSTISDIEMDENGILWIATIGEGIYLMKDSVIASCTTHDGLPSDNINALFMDKKFVWASTYRGLSRIKLNTSGNFSFQISNLGKHDGLPTEEINYTFVDGDTVYVATNGGAAIFNQNNFFTESTAPLVYIEGIKINGADTTAVSTLSLSHFQNDLSFVALGISFKSRGNIRYKYMLEGAESEWKFSDSRIITYPLLAPGNYNFILNAVNADGIESETPARVSFVINPPYWQTLWFISLIFILVIAIATVIILLVIRYYRNQNRLMERIFNAEQGALRSQMNPHFIFNALYSIQSFITKSDQYSANLYLAKFSSLIRMMLDYSRKVNITLAEEVNFLKTYLEIESLRFENKFDYKIDVDASVDIYKTRVVSMLIQPFVENSIRHGLLPKKTKGELKIFLTKENGFLSCSVEDNGIGREKAMEHKTGKSFTHISQGITITQERLALLKNGNHEGRISVVDLTDETGNAAGTKVIIKIPYS